MDNQLTERLEQLVSQVNYLENRIQKLESENQTLAQDNNVIQSNNNLLQSQINSMGHILQQFQELFANDIDDKINNIDCLKKLNTDIKALNDDYQRTKTYLDNIDDTLDQFEDLLMNLAREHEIIISGLVKLKTESDIQLAASIKDNIILMSSLSVVLYELIFRGVINGDTYITNFTKVIEDITNVYRQNDVDLDFSNELEALKGNIKPDGISIRLPHISTDISDSEFKISVPMNKEQKIISIHEVKRMKADKQKITIKNAKKKSEQLRNSLDEDELKKPDNVIENIFEKIKELRDKKGKDK